MSRLTKLVERLKRKEAEDERREKANKIAERTAALAVKTILGHLRGHTLAAAAPVVFQAMCRKEGIFGSLHQAICRLCVQAIKEFITESTG